MVLGAAVSAGLALSLAGGLVLPAGQVGPAAGVVPGAVVPAAPRMLSSEFFGMHAITIPPSGIPGVASVRLWDTDTTWRVLNPRPGVYRWATLDARVAAAAQSGAAVLLVLGATPQWAAASISRADAPWLGPGSASPPRRPRQWTQFVSAVVTRYAGRIEAYQVWNEPADRLFWRGSTATLAQMTRQAYDIVHATDPTAKVVAAPLIVRTAHWQSKARSYLRALAGQRWPVDVLAFHGYASGAPGPSAHLNAIERVRAFVDASGAPALPLWETEVNYPDTGTVARPLRLRTERAWLARTYLDAARLGIDRVYWYAYAQVPTNLAVDIRRPGVSPAFAAVAGWMTDATIVGCVDDWQSLSGVTGCSFVDRSGRSSVALWSARPHVVAAGRGQGSDLQGTTWSVGSRLFVSSTPVWFRPAATAD